MNTASRERRGGSARTTGTSANKSLRSMSGIVAAAHCEPLLYGSHTVAKTLAQPLYEKNSESPSYFLHTVVHSGAKARH